jgi:hypothetical protein
LPYSNRSGMPGMMDPSETTLLFKWPAHIRAVIRAVTDSHIIAARVGPFVPPVTLIETNAGR